MSLIRDLWREVQTVPWVQLVVREVPLVRCHKGRTHRSTERAEQTGRDLGHRQVHRYRHMRTGAQTGAQV